MLISYKVGLRVGIFQLMVFKGLSEKAIDKVNLAEYREENE